MAGGLQIPVSVHRMHELACGETHALTQVTGEWANRQSELDYQADYAIRQSAWQKKLGSRDVHFWRVS